jgi:hypothetical protein
MKTFIFLLVVILVISAMILKMRKSQAEADLARRKALERKKRKQKEAITQNDEVIWPVIIRPVGGKAGAEEDPEAEEPQMTAIEFEPSEKKAG